ncbi:MAG TPA: thioredoxin domain-containing protein [Gemmatimonadaceae bacterium]|nr:thioredoxin domain-containing protein [Gemmatimonadaceae bacterium]
MHWPLSYHRVARPAAQAAECAEKQGRFGEFVDAIYRNQDSLLLKSWNSFAKDAGVLDVRGFEACSNAATTFARIDSGAAFAKRWGLRGTPTVLVNGWRFGAAPQASEMYQLIDDLLAGKAPARR